MHHALAALFAGDPERVIEDLPIEDDVSILY